jgi:aspartate-semialdehyde dehydrogenase
MAEHSAVAIYATLGPALEALLERLAKNQSIGEILPVAADGDGETVIWRGRPVAVLDRVDLEVGAVVFLDDAALAQAHIDQYLNSTTVVLDATGTLVQQGEGRWYYGGELDPAGRLWSIAGSVASHCVALLRHLRHAPTAVQAAVCLPVSWHGKKGIDALAHETARLLNGQAIENTGLGQQIAFNVLSDHHGIIAAQTEQQLAGYLGDSLDICCHSVTVPVFFGHHISLIVDCADVIDYSALFESLAGSEQFRLNTTDETELASPACLVSEFGIDIVDICLDKRSERRLRCTLVGDNLRDGVIVNIASALDVLIKSDI